MFGITWAQISGIVQRILMFAGGLAVGKGWISEELMVQIVGAAMSIAGILWGVKNNTPAALVSTVNSMPEVVGVVTKPTEEGKALAAAIPSLSVAPAGTSAAVAVANDSVHI